MKTVPKESYSHIRVGILRLNMTRIGVISNLLLPVYFSEYVFKSNHSEIAYL